MPVREGWAIVGAIEEAVGKVAKTTKVVYCEGEELDVVGVEGGTEGSAGGIIAVAGELHLCDQKVA